MLVEAHYYDSNGEKVMKQTKKLRDRFDDERGYLLYYNGITVNSKAGIDFPSEMNKLEIANMAMLSRHLVAFSNYIGYRGNGGIIKPMNVKQIGEVIGVAERQTYRFLKKMIDLEMMAKATIETGGEKKEHYFVNPLFFMNGRNINDLLYWVFQDQLDAHLPEWAKIRYMERRKDDDAT